MKSVFEELVDDLKLQSTLDLPTGDWEKKLDKISCVLWHGRRIGWMYADDAKICKEHGRSPYVNPVFSGLVIAKPDVESSPGGTELEWDECVIVIDVYPTEKCDPEVHWTTLGRLLDKEDLIEVFEVKP